MTERHRAADDVLENAVGKWLERSDFSLEEAAQGAVLVAHPGRMSRELASRLRNALKLLGCQPVRKRLKGAKNPTRCFSRPAECVRRKDAS